MRYWMMMIEYKQHIERQAHSHSHAHMIEYWKAIWRRDFIHNTRQQQQQPYQLQRANMGWMLLEII